MARLKNPPENYIACCVCLNIRGERTPAVTTIRGYSVCDQHRALASHPEFDIFTVRGKTVRPV